MAKNKNAYKNSITAAGKKADKSKSESSYQGKAPKTDGKEVSAAPLKKGKLSSDQTSQKAADAKKEKKFSALTDTSGVDGYFRPEVAVSRWKLGYEVFMGNFMKMIGLNVLMLVFVAPILILLFLRTSTIYYNASISPFSANMGVGYLPFTTMLGLEESINYSANYQFFMWLPLAALFLGIGISGGMYVMRNLVWGESVPVFKTFFRGIKKNVLYVLIATAVYSVILSGSFIVISNIDYTGAVDGWQWYYTLFKVILYVVIGLTSLHYLAMVSMTVTYTGNFFALLKNTFVFTIVLLPLNLFFGVMALAAYAIMLFGQSALSLALILIMFLGNSFAMLVWTTYSQWIYSKFVDGKVKTYDATEDEIKKHASRAKEAKPEDEGYTEVGKSGSIMDGVTPVTDYDVTVGSLDEVFTRKDIENISKSKDNL